jgi:hypothetical protein
MGGTIHQCPKCLHDMHRHNFTFASHFKSNNVNQYWSQWPHAVRRRYVAASLPRLWVRIPPAAWMSVVSTVCSQVQVSATSWFLVWESYRLWYVVCDLETLWISRPRPTGGCCGVGGEENKTKLNQWWASNICPILCNAACDIISETKKYATFNK